MKKKSCSLTLSAALFRTEKKKNGGKPPCPGKQQKLALAKG
jgi:hypothetical protein